MRYTYAFEVIDTFSPEESQAFRHFLDSPYFNRGHQAKQHKALFQLLEEIRQHPDPEYGQKNRAYERLYPDSPVVAGKLDKLLSEFKKLLHTFLCAQRYLNDDNADKQLLDLAANLRLRNLPDKYDQVLRQVKKRAAAPNSESRSEYQFRLQLALEEHEQNSMFNKVKGDLNIPDLINHLDRYYYANRLELLNRLLLQGKLVQLPKQSLVLLAEPFSIPETCLASGNLFRIPWEIRTMLQAVAPAIGDFEAIHALLRDEESKIAPELLKDYFTYVRNLCTVLIDFKGVVELGPVLFQIQRDNLARGYFYYQGKIPPHAMLNITVIAVLMKELPWAIDFVEQHKDRILGERETRDVYRINQAICLFAEKKYAEALDVLPFGTSDSYFHLLARRIELKIYFEQDSDLLPYKIDAFKKYIQRASNKLLSREIYEIHLHFINLLQQLSASPKTKARTRSEQLIRRIQAPKRVAERIWLLEKARALGERGRTASV